MPNVRNPTETFMIKPTSTVEGERLYSDISMSNVFSVNAATVNAGKQLIWQRYQALLVANSILMGLTAKDSGQHVLRARLLLTLGILLCVIWATMSWLGWAGSTRRMRALARIQWTATGITGLTPSDKEFSPVVETGLWKDWIYLLSMLVILLFGVGYVILWFA